MANKNNLNDNLKKLSEIVRWFEDQKEADVELGLEKVKEGAILIKSCRERLKTVENEFEEIQKQLNEDLADLS